MAHTHIRRRIEEANEYALNEQEESLITAYRVLDITSRKVINDLVADMLRIKN